MTEHTPGPWVWWTSNSWRRLRRSERGVSTNILLPTVCSDGQPDIDVSQADMRLIAAAPNMLAALRRILLASDDDLFVDATIAVERIEVALVDCRQAVAKATDSANGD